MTENAVTIFHEPFNPLYTDDHYSGHLPKINGIAKFNSCSLTRLILKNVPHLFLALETTWCFYRRGTISNKRPPRFVA